MEKYKFENNKAVVDLQCIITISKSSVSIEHASNTDSVDIPDAGLTIQVGNVESYNPTSLSPEPEPEIIPTPTPSGGGDIPSGGGDEPGGGGETPVDPTPTPSGNKSVIVKLTNPQNSNKTVTIYGVVFYVTPTANVTDCYVNENDTLHAGLDTYKENQNITLTPGQSHTFIYEDVTPWMNWLNTDKIYWQNGLSHDGTNPVLIYTRAHWSEDYHANNLSGLIEFGKEYTFTIN